MPCLSQGLSGCATQQDRPGAHSPGRAWVTCDSHGQGGVAPCGVCTAPATVTVTAAFPQAGCLRASLELKT